MDTQVEDDKLYAKIKRSDLVLLCHDRLPKKRSPALVTEVHDVRTLTLVAVPSDRLDMSEAQQLADLDFWNTQPEATIFHEVPRFNRSGGSDERHNTWCGVH